MKLTIIKYKNKIYKNLYKYYVKLYLFNKIILVLENKYEFLDLYYTSKFFLRKKIKGYDKEDITKDNLDFIKKKIIPVTYGFTTNYIGNITIGFYDTTSIFPYNSDVGIIKIIGPGELSDDTLYAYENIDYYFNKILNNETESHYYYVDWNTNSIYTKFISKYPAKIFTLDYTNIIKKKNVYICNFDYFTKDNKLNELSSFPGRLLFSVYGLDMLEKNGTLYINYYHTSYNFSIQLLYLISTYFKEYEFIKSDNMFVSFDGIYIFKKYIGEHSLKTLLTQYLLIDNTLGKKYLTNSLDKIMYIDLKITVDKDFLNFIKKIIFILLIN